MRKVYIYKMGMTFSLSLVFVLMAGFTLAQVPISGKVTSEAGEGLPGVNVVVKGTTQGTITDVEGNYALNVPSVEAVLVFSYVGYLTEEMSVGSRSTVNMVMTPDIQTLGEIVVVGYGTEKRSDLTGSIATVSAEDFARVPVVNPLDLLGGRAPGLTVNSTSGMPGANSNVVIRGVQSINDRDSESEGSSSLLYGNGNQLARENSPLYVIDGLITDGINNISPNDIESISVLKDAAATAIYGSRAANGVIIVTTKRGRGKPQISFHTFVGVQGEGNLRRKLLNGEQYLEIFNEAYSNSAPNAPSTRPWLDSDLDQYAGINTDWKELIKRTGVIQNYELSVSGGNDNSNFYLSGGYKDNKFFVKGYNFEKYTLVLNSDHKIGDRIKFGNSLNLYKTKNIGDFGSFEASYWRDALVTPPIKEAFDETGDYAQIKNTALEGGGHVLFGLDRNVNNRDVVGLMGSLYLTVDIAKGLSATVRESVEWEQWQRKRFEPGIDPAYNFGGNPVNKITKEQVVTGHTITDFLLNYTRQFGEHNVSGLLGYSVEEWQRETLAAARPETLNDEIQYVSAGNLDLATNENRFIDWAFLSTFGKFNYSFKDKYLLSFSIRRDGSSRLAEGNRFDVFPAVSAGWKVTDEPFMSNTGFINNLKIRASYGVVGNVLSLGVYEASPELDQLYAAANQAIVTGYTNTKALNRDIKWETSLKRNLGFDLRVMNDHIYSSIDVYMEDTKDLHLENRIPPSAGKNGSPTVNAGLIRNTGLEIFLGYVNTFKDWTVDFNVNYSTNKNEAIDLNGVDFRSQGTIEGYPVNSFFGYKTNGIIYDEETVNSYPHLFDSKYIGDIWVRDIDGEDENGDLTGQPDGEVDEDDRTIIGRKYPKGMYGFTGTVGYKNFTLQVQLQGVYGVDKDIATAGNADFGLMHYFQRWALNHDAMILDRHHPTKNPDGRMPRVDINDYGHNRDPSDFWLKDASFLRVKNVNLSYRFSDSMISKAGMTGLSMYLSIQNLYTFTSFPGLEVDTNVVDPISALPQPRSWTVGLRANF